MAVNRILVGLLAFFVAAVLALAGIIVWRESLRGFTAKDRVIIKYRSYFRTPAQQAELVSKMDGLEKEDPLVVNVTVTNSTSSCSIFCVNTYGNNSYGNASQFTPRQNRRKRSIGSLHYHGCCKSYSSFSTPTVLKNILGQDVKIAQFPELMQFFKIEHCEQQAGCVGCTCSQDYNYVSAVIRGDDDDDFDDLKVTVQIVKMPGCCKCINY